MAGGKSNTQRIETLENQAANMAARLEVHEILIEGLKDFLKTGTEAIQGHTSKIIVIEERLLVLVDLKAIQATIVALEKENLAFRKDVESLQKWKDELKKEKDEATRRLWAFGPNITAAIISGIVTFMGIGITVALNYWLNKLR